MNDSASVLSPDDVDRIVTHMNEAHTEDLVRCVQAYANVPTVEDVHMTSIDAYGFDLTVDRGEATVPVRIDFDTPLETAGDARSTLAELALAARGDAER